MIGSSIYEDGIGALAGIRARQRGGAAVGQLGVIAMPAAQAARMIEVGRFVDGLELDVARYTPRPELAVAWSAWRDQWGRFLADWRAFSEKTDWIDRTWGSTATQIEAYATQACAWAEAFGRQWRGQITAPLMASCGTRSAWPEWLRAIAIAVAAGLVTTGVLWLVRRRDES